MKWRATRGYLLAGRYDSIVLSRVVNHGGFPAPANEPVRGSGHRRNDDRHLLASPHLSFHVARYIADILDVGHRRAAEFHDQTAHASFLDCVKILESAAQPVYVSPDQKARPSRRARAIHTGRFCGMQPREDCSQAASGPLSPMPISVEPAEVEKFSSRAAEWWNPAGTFALLHKFNPLRIEYIREQVTARYARDPFQRLPFSGLRFLDIGCGGGLLSEPMARLGAAVLGADPSEENIKTAAVHARAQSLAIDYRFATAEQLALGERFDVILAMEVVEHVNDPGAFIATCASMLRPRGLIFVATLNRTLKSFGLAIIGAEYILGWLPKGTHQWEKFITPAELKNYLISAGLKVIETIGVDYNPLTGGWARSRNMGVNYLALAQRCEQ